MSKLSFFQFFSDFLPKNRAKFDHFSLFFEFHQSLFMHFSDAEIPIVKCNVFTMTIRTDLDSKIVHLLVTEFFKKIITYVMIIT